MKGTFQTNQILNTIISRLNVSMLISIPGYITKTYSDYEFSQVSSLIAKISVASPFVINMPTRELLAGETKNYFV